jgi:hypothetical protein
LFGVSAELARTQELLNLALSLVFLALFFALGNRARIQLDLILVEVFIALFFMARMIFRVAVAKDPVLEYSSYADSNHSQCPLTSLCSYTTMIDFATAVPVYVSLSTLCVVGGGGPF